MSEKLHLYIGGKQVETENYTPVYNKFTDEKIAEISIATKENVTEAVSAAEKVFNESTLTPFERYNILLKAAEITEERRKELELSLVREVGKTLKDAQGELERTINTLRLSAEEAKRISGEMVPLQASEGAENRLGYTIRVPKGVIGAITPFNYPLLLNTHKIAPAIAAGNTIVVKPSPITPIATYQLVEILEAAGLPKGHINIINGPGSEAGSWLLEDERIKMYTFTGSAQVGKLIKENTGLRPVSLELGNNSPNIVHQDADLEAAAQLLAARSYHNAGQACIAVQRIYVHESVIEKFSEHFVHYTNRLKVGNPEDPETDIGPLITEEEALRAEQWVQEAIEQGATPLTEIKRDGAILYPAVLTNTKHEMKVVCQEVFAPVVTIIPYATIEEAYDRANDSEYGLQAGIFTNDLQIAMEATQKLQFGGVMINDVSTYRNDVMPYGGIKNSGLGKEGPRYAIEEMTDEKMVVLNL